MWLLLGYTRLIVVKKTMWTIRLRDSCLMFLNVFYIDKVDDRSVLIRRSRFLRNVDFPEASNSTFSINDIAGAAATHRWQTCPSRNIATDVTFGWIVFVVEKSGAVWVDNMWQGWTNFAGEVNQLCGKRCHFGWLNLVRSFMRELVGVLWWKLVDDLFSFVKHPCSVALDTPWCLCGGCDFSWWQREYFGGSIFQWLSALLQMFSCDVFQGVLYSHVLCSN